MAEVPVRELNHNTAAVLARVKRGEPVDITDRGVVIARLVPAHPDPLSDLMKTGKLHPATNGGPAPRPAGPVQREQGAGELLRQLRDAERY